MAIEMTTRDHLCVGLHAILIYLSLKLALSPVPYVALYGWFLIIVNIWSFDSYCHKRKNDTRN